MTRESMEQDAEARIAAHRMGDFRITLQDAAGVPVPAARVEVALTGHDFRLGANGFLIRGCDHQPPGGPLDAGVVQAYEQAVVSMLNVATLPVYWGSFEPQAGAERMERLRTMADWCRRHGLRTKGHPLAWHAVFPAWAAALDDAVVLQRLRERITRLVGELRGLVDTWDVFNEVTVATNFDNAVGRWVRDRGAAECVAEALRLARAANPGAELLYNDFNVSPAFEELVGQLQARGVAFDAIGIQSHMHKWVWSPEKLWETCETYARFGLPLHFTELTILSGRLKAADDNDWGRRQTGWDSTPEGEQRQLEEGRRLYTLLFSHPAVEAVTWWDFSDLHAWQGAPAGLLRADMSPKPLAEWLRQAFGEQWTTRVALTADPGGQAAFRGFFGTYTVRARTAGGADLTGSATFPRNGARQVAITVTP